MEDSTLVAHDFIMPLSAFTPELKGSDFRLPMGFILRIAEAARRAAMGRSSQRPLTDIFGEIARKSISNSDLSSIEPIGDVVRAQQVQLYSDDGTLGVAHAGFRPFTDLSARVRTCIADVRHRSVTFRTDIYRPTDGMRLATVWCVVVLINPLKSVAVPLPHRIKEHCQLICQPDGYQSAFCPTFPLRREEPTARLDKTGQFRCFFQLSARYNVGLSQVGGDHVNQSRYLDWYDDMYYWAVTKAPQGDMEQYQQQDRERALSIARARWPSTGLVARAEYDRETFPASRITVQMRWIERISDGVFVGFVFETIEHPGETAELTWDGATINNRAVYYFDPEAAQMVSVPKL